jgi:putative membrane protein
MTPSDLPAVNASLNAVSAVLLSAGYYFIRRKNQSAHHRCMIGAFVASALFLACYVTYHSYRAYYLHQGPTVFKEPAAFRPVYLAILLTHTVLAAAVVPFALVTFSRALRRRFDSHRRIARWTWPVWMYVSVTGVVIYLLLYQIFPQH